MSVWGNDKCISIFWIKATFNKVHLWRTHVQTQFPERLLIHFYINNYIGNISLYALSWLKLNFRHFLTFWIIFQELKLEISAFLVQIARFDILCNPISMRFVIIFLLLNEGKFWRLGLNLVRHSCTLLYQYIFFV